MSEPTSKTRTLPPEPLAHPPRTYPIRDYDDDDSDDGGSNDFPPSSINAITMEVNTLQSLPVDL